MRPKEIGLFIQYLFIFQFKTSFCFSIASTAAFGLKRIEMSVDSNEKYLTPITPDQVRLEIKDPVDPTALTQAKDILKELRSSDDETTLNGTVDPARLMSVAKKLGDIPTEMATYVATKEECKAAFDGLSDVERTSLENIHARVLAFATAQRQSVTDCVIDIPGGKAGHTVSPCSGKFEIPERRAITCHLLYILVWKKDKL